MSDSTVFIPPERRARRGSFVPPLLILPLIIYNIIAFVFMGGTPVGWGSNVLMTIPMVSGIDWQLTAGDLMLGFGLICLFVEVLKATNTGRASVIEHMLSTLVFVVFLVEFLLVGACASSVFFILMLMALFDVVAGFTVSITSAGRDVNMA